MNYIKISKKVKKFAKENVKKSRFEHSKRVAKLCKQIAKKYGFDVDKAYLAGIGHDICKDFSNQRLIELSKKNEYGVIDFELQKISLLHGKAAAVVLQNDFGIEDKDIYEAVSFHTSGKPDMCELTKCIYIADKIEPGRPQSSKKYIKSMLQLPFEELFYTILKSNYDYIVSQGYSVYPGTETMINKSESYLKKIGGNK